MVHGPPNLRFIIARCLPEGTAAIWCGAAWWQKAAPAGRWRQHRRRTGASGYINQDISGFKHAELLGELRSPTSIVAVRRCTWCGMLRRKKIAVQLCATAASAEVTGQNIHPVERRKGRGWMTMLSYLYCNWKVVRAMVERVEDQLVYTQAILKQPSIRSVAACSRWFAQRCKRNNSLRNLSPFAGRNMTRCQASMPEECSTKGKHTWQTHMDKCLVPFPRRRAFFLGGIQRNHSLVSQKMWLPFRRPGGFLKHPAIAI